jgi:hypothetical protein
MEKGAIAIIAIIVILFIYFYVRSDSEHMTIPMCPRNTSYKSDGHVIGKPCRSVATNAGSRNAHCSRTGSVLSPTKIYCWEKMI